MTIALNIDGNLQSRLHNLAQLRHQSLDDMMNRAVEQFIQREEAGESFRQEALDSWAEHQETGLHITGEELIEWAETHGSNLDEDLPECHV